MSHSVITVSDRDRERGHFSASTLQSVLQRFQISGVLKIDEMWPPEVVEAWHDAYLAQLDLTDDGKGVRDALEVGRGRYMTPVALSGVFNDPRLYGSPFLSPLLRSILGDDLVLNSLGAVVSFPGSDMQHFHYDHPHLFPEAESMSIRLPCFAVTVAIPLVNMDEVNGKTMFWPGSHHLGRDHHPPNDLAEEYGGARGCAYLWDYRVLHGGWPNVSGSMRPLLYMVFSRPWFRDTVNFRTVNPLSIPGGELSRVPEAHQGLFRLV